ncbi:MAG: glycosyltransferase family 2 protein [Acutalibacteraceae bacterium]|nr:glycosyltransferase family 2 protein [Acutalibacteraceae bacterium]
MKTVDLVVPCYNEEEGLKIFVRETTKVTDNIQGYDFTFILVNDGSKDNTYKVMKQLAKQYENVKYISFSRNFGKESAMYAGLKYSNADYVVVMDADLQHPPKMLVDMCKAMEEGYDCCAARRVNREGESKIRSFFSQSFYKISNKISDVKMPYGAVDYRMMTRQMVDAVVSLSEVQRFSKGLFCWVGFDTKWIPYQNVERAVGTTKWSFWGLFKYAIDGFASFTVSPLRWLSAIGSIISFVAFIYIIITLLQTLFFGITVEGYVTTLCAILFLGGIIELSIGVLGEYISRIYMESKHRPIFLVKDTNMDNNCPDKNDKCEKDKNLQIKNISGVKNEKSDSIKKVSEKIVKQESEKINIDKNLIKNTKEEKNVDNQQHSENESEKVEYDLSYFE